MTSETNAPAMTLTAAGDILNIVVTGEVRVDQIRHLKARMRQHPGFDTINGVLVDFREADLTRVGADDVRWLAATDITLGTDQKLAIVVTGPFSYGLARMFEQLRGSRTQVRVFQQPDAGREWLAEDP